VTLTGLQAVASTMSSFAPFEKLVEALSTPLIPKPATMKLAAIVTQGLDSTLFHNEFALCLRSLLGPFLAMCPYEFAICM